MLLCVWIWAFSRRFGVVMGWDGMGWDDTQFFYFKRWNGVGAWRLACCICVCTVFTLDIVEKQSDFSKYNSHIDLKKKPDFNVADDMHHAPMP